SAASIVLAPLRSIVTIVLGFGLLWWFVPPSGRRDTGLAILLAFLLVRVAWQLVWMLCARYELTTARVRATTGVFSRFSVEIPLARVQNTVLSQLFPERLAGVGTIGIASAGTDLIEITWSMVDRPHEVLAEVRRALTGAPGPDGLGAES